MDISQREILYICSRLFSYPHEEDEKVVQECLDDLSGSEKTKKEIRNAVKSIYRIPLHERQELYVSTFDLKAKYGLYLSSHEYGDSPKRGAALIKLQKVVNEGGYERKDGELADYIPMLFEFIAVTADQLDHVRLVKRLGCVMYRILLEFSKDHPYHAAIALLMDHVFEKPTRDELLKVEQEREEADLEDLPYPIMYN